jgi:uncharacterized protein
MRKDDLGGMTRLELLEEAKRLEIRGRSTMSKERLVEAVAAAARPKSGRAPARPAPGAASPRGARKARDAEPSSPPADVQPKGGTRTTEPRAGTPRPAVPPAPPRAGAPDGAPAPASGAERPDKPSPHEDDDEEGQNWNSTALGRDPNYGRFLNPGSMPSRNPPVIRRGAGGPPSPIAKSLAERSELGRQRAGERSFSPREDLRRGGVQRRDSGYTQRYERDRRPVDPRVERGRGRVDEAPHRGAQGGRSAQDGGRGGRPPGGPAIDRRGPGEGRHEREDRHATDRRGGAQGRPRPGGPAPIESRHRGPRDARDADGPVIEAPRQRGDAGEAPRTTWSADVPETRTRVPEPTPPPPPPPRNLDRCRLMVRDPHCVHAYWEVTEESVERLTTELAGEFSESRPILRVHGIPISGDPDEPPAGFFDVDLAADATSAYVDVPRPNRGYRVDVGVVTAQGLFIPLASSNTVITPRDSASRDVTEAWAKPPAAGAPMAPAPPPAGGTGEPAASGPAEGGSQAATGSGAAPALDRGAAGDSGAGLAMDGRAGAVPARELTAASGQGLAPAGPGIPPGPSRLEGEAVSPEARRRAPRPFHFEVHTELVVYGATEPGATVSLQGAPVALRPDGTFSLRVQLPDGEQVLRAVAVSRDGRVERVITPVVTRRTTEPEETRRD